MSIPRTKAKRLPRRRRKQKSRGGPPPPTVITMELIQEAMRRGEAKREVLAAHRRLGKTNMCMEWLFPGYHRYLGYMYLE